MSSDLVNRPVVGDNFCGCGQSLHHGLYRGGMNLSGNVAGESWVKFGTDPSEIAAKAEANKAIQGSNVKQSISENDRFFGVCLGLG